MKKALKCLSLMVAAAIALSSAAYASESMPASVGASESMPSTQEVLAAVKVKLDIPEEFSEFQSSANTYESGTYYSFIWSTSDSSARITVASDSLGRINSYRYYASDMYEDQQCALAPKSEAALLAEGFLRQITPELFTDTDTLVYSPDSSSARILSASRGSSYVISFKRVKNGIPVTDNSASVSIRSIGGELTITSAVINIDRAEFSADEAALDTPAAAYQTAFPLEAIYENSYNADASNDSYVGLYYRLQSGYISAVDGSVVEKDSYSDYETDTTSSSASGYAADLNSSEDSEVEFTEAELAELAQLESLKSEEDIETALKEMPEISFDSSLNRISSRIYKSDDDYLIQLYFSNDDFEGGYKSLIANVNAKTGQILYLYLYNYSYDESSYEFNYIVTDEEKSRADSAMDAFVQKYAPDEYPLYAKDGDSTVSGNYVSASYTRSVDGTPYINNTIQVRYDVRTDTVSYYRLKYDDDKSFASKDYMISPEEAYSNIYSAYPLELVYVKSGGEYRLCYSINRSYVKIDAITAEISNTGVTISDYSDISGHWCESAAELLADYGIGFEGGMLYPDEAVDESDFLKLIDDAIGYSYTSLSADQADDSADAGSSSSVAAHITREEAFAYFVKAIGYGRIAELNGIFKVDFADGSQLSEDKLGAAAILSGMGVIAGHGGYIRPKDYLTRAEAIMLVYNYFSGGNK